jgi:hypothetical protein
MKSALRLFAASILVIFAGCDHEARLTNLENDNQDLQAEIGKNAKNPDFDLQSKCARNARTWFNDTWSRDKDTILLDYTNHYNKRSNQCFILVEYHYHLDKNGSWVNDMNLYDVYENAKYGNISKNTMIYFKPTYRTGDLVYGCEVGDKKCATLDEFNNLVRPYMSD